MLGQAFLLMVLVACDKDNDVNPSTISSISQAEIQAILDTDVATSSIDLILSELHQNTDNSDKGQASNCYTVTSTENGFSVTFDTCALGSSEEISGTLDVVLGTGTGIPTYIATFQDFFVGKVNINGSRTIRFTETRENLVFAVSGDLTLTFDDGSTLRERGTKSFSMVFENELQNTLSGNWIVEFDGKGYAISGVVSKTGECDYWTSGSLELTKDFTNVSVDFGDGSCDDQALITFVDGNSLVISL